MLNYFFKTVDVDLCPEVKGRIVDKGKPVADIKILRQLVFNGSGIVEDHTYTDNDGKFSLPAKSIKVPKRKISITANVVTQNIIIQDQDKKFRKWDSSDFYRLWQLSQHGYKNKPAVIKKLLAINCDLNDQEVYFLFDYQENSTKNHKCEQNGFSICRWDDDFKILKTY